MRSVLTALGILVIVWAKYTMAQSIEGGTITCQVRSGEQAVGSLVVAVGEEKKLDVDSSTWVFAELRDMGPNARGNHGRLLQVGVSKKDVVNPKNTNGIYVGGTGVLAEGWVASLNLDVNSIHFICRR